MNGITTQTAATQQDPGKAARALGNAQTLLRDLRREAIELPVKLSEAQASMDVQAITALHERRRTLPASVHMARMSALAAGIDAIKAELGPLQETEAQLVKEVTDLQGQIQKLQARMKDANERLMPVRSEVNGMRSLLERKAEALRAEQEYLISPEAADDPTDSVWALLPNDPDEGLKALITQITAIRTLSIYDEAHVADDARLLAVLNEASSVFRAESARSLGAMTMQKGIPIAPPSDAVSPTGDKALLLKHLREELSLILA